jgi:tetratricopeptide (TPR) repeat protein
MAQQGKHSGEPSESATLSSTLVKPPDQNQLDFELDFFGRILESHPNFIDVLRVHGNNLSLKGRYADGLAVDKRLVHLRPGDPLAFYNLACSYALLKKAELALKTLRRAIELGYRDFRYMREDRDLDSIRRDPRFRQLLREFESV